MGITSRKVRSLKRTPEVPRVRDARLVVIAAEDTYAAKQYFESDLFHSSRIQIEVLETPNSDEAENKKTASSPGEVETRLRGYIAKYDLNDEDILCIMVDRDRWPDSTLADISQKTFRKKRKNILMAVSNPCFEVWLFLHVSDWNKSISHITSKKMTLLLRQTLGEYNKNSLNIEKYRGRILLACDRAKNMDSSSTDRWPQTIGTYVYRLIEELKAFCDLH